MCVVVNDVCGGLGHSPAPGFVVGGEGTVTEPKFYDISFANNHVCHKITQQIKYI